MRTEILSHEYLLSILDYNSDTGIFTWKINRGRGAKIGAIAGTPREDGYTVIRIDQIFYRSHRLAWFYINRVWPPAFIDHKNGIRNDNRVVNLRLATPSQNQMNRKIASGGTSKHKGVFHIVETCRWKAQIKINQTPMYIGIFDTEAEAVNAYNAEAVKLFGEYARF